MNRSVVVLFFSVVVIRLAIGWVSLAKLDADPDAYRAIAQTLAQTGVYGLSDGQGEASPTAFRPPLYPFLLSWMTNGGRLSSWSVAVFHAVLAGWTAVFTYGAARSFLGERTRPTQDPKHFEESGRFGSPMIAAVLVSIDPILVEQSRQVMTESLATTIVALVMWWCSGLKAVVGNLEEGSDGMHWQRQVKCGSLVWAVVLGGLLSLAFFCRPTFIVWALFLILGTWMRRASSTGDSNGPTPAKVSWFKRWIGWQNRSWLVPITTSAVIGCSVVGWMVRNQFAIGAPVWATSHGGYTLLLSNNPMFYDYLEESAWGETWDAEPFFEAYAHRYEGDPRTGAFWETDWKNESKAMPDNVAEETHNEVRREVDSETRSEMDDDRLLYESAKATIHREPRMFVYSCVVRLGRLWAPFPHLVPGRSKGMVMGVGLFYVTLYAAVIGGLWKRRFDWKHPVYWTSIALAVTLSGVHTFYWSNQRMRAPIAPALAILAVASLGSLLPEKDALKPLKSQAKGMS